MLEINLLLKELFLTQREEVNNTKHMKLRPIDRLQLNHMTNKTNFMYNFTLTSDEYVLCQIIYYIYLKPIV